MCMCFDTIVIDEAVSVLYRLLGCEKSYRRIDMNPPRQFILMDALLSPEVVRIFDEFWPLTRRSWKRCTWYENTYVNEEWKFTQHIVKTEAVSAKKKSIQCNGQG